MRKKVLAALVLAASFSITSIGAAHASDGRDNLSDSVADALDRVAQVFPDFDPSGEVVVVDSTGSARSADVDSGAPVSPLAGCSFYNFVAPGTFSWYTSVPGCSLIGWNDSARAGYNWSRGSASSGMACVQAKGFSKISPGNYQPIWGSAGCGIVGSANMQWGNVAASKQVRAYATSSPVGFAGQFQ